jgi:hypothetical protein
MISAIQPVPLRNSVHTCEPMSSPPVSGGAVPVVH